MDQNETATPPDVDRERAEIVGPAALWDMKRRFQHDFLTGRGLRPDHHVLDLGCGNLRGGIPLIEYVDVGHYWGLEVRAVALADGLRALQESGLEDRQPTLVLCPSRLDEFPITQPFEFVWSFSVLIHMPPKVLSGALQLVARVLTADGRMYANVNLGEKEVGYWEQFPVMTMPWEYYEHEAAAVGLSVTDIGRLGDLGHESGVGRQDDHRMLEFRRRP